MNKKSILFVIFLVFSKVANVEIALAGDPYMAGVNVNGQWDQSYTYPVAKTIAEWIPTINSNWASVQVTLWQERAESNEVWESKIERCNVMSPTQDSIKSYIALLHAKGLKVSLKVHVGVADPCDQTASGSINPTSPNSWFQSYQSKLLEYADIAQNYGVEMFAFGNELAMLSKQYDSQWVNLISKIRERYKGKLTYCAIFPNESNVDDSYYEYKNVVFWNLVDYIGINLWASVSEEKTPSVEVIKAGYYKFKQKLDGWNSENGFSKKIIITEYGVPNRNKCVKNPQVAEYDNTISNPDCQKNGYEAFFEVFGYDRNIAGMFSHEDLVGHPELTDKTDFYQIRGNSKAEDIVRKWFLNLIENERIVVAPSNFLLLNDN